MVLGEGLNIVSSRRRLALFAACCLCVLAGALAFASVPASAAQKRELLRSFGLLSDPQGIAVDLSTGEASSGDVYVADTGEHSVQAFTGAGVFISSFGTFTTPQFVAVDNDSKSSSFHDVYVADTGNDTVQKFTPAGALVTTWGTGGLLNGSTTKATAFGSVAGITVGADGTLYVLNKGDEVFEFDEAGVFQKEVELELGVPVGAKFQAEALGFAVSPGGDLFKANESGSISRFTASGEDTGWVVGGRFEKPGAGAFTIDPSSGDLYVAGLNGSLERYEFNGSGEVLEPGGGTCAPSPAIGLGCEPSSTAPIGFAGTGIALSGAGDVYLANAVAGTVAEYGPLVTVPSAITEAASEVLPTSLRLNGKVNPESIALSECVFEYVEAAKYRAGAANPYEGGGVAACADPDAAEVPVDFSEHEVHADVAGLNPGTVYDYRLKVTDVEGGFETGANETAETTPLPSIDSATVSGLTSEDATLDAQIDPHGSAAHYRFEYDTREYAQGEGAHGTRVPAGAEPAIAASTSDVFVAQRIAGLKHDTTYYWRVVATNASGTTTSVGHTFVYPTNGEGLPDGRAYEMITPAQKNGALLSDVAFIGLVPNVAADGARVTASAIQCFAGAQSCNAQSGDGVGSLYEFTRTSGGWVTTPLAPPATEFSSNTPWQYNAGTGTALFSMATPPFGENDFYLREPDGSFVDIGPNTPPELGAQGPAGGQVGGNYQVQTADFSHLVWEVPKNIRWPFDERNAGTITAYEYAGVDNPRPLLVGVTGGMGSHSLISKCGTSISSEVPGTISEDGRTVFFTAKRTPTGPCLSGSGANEGVAVPADTVYARVDGELSDAHTVAISAPSPSECGSGSESGEVACREAVGKPANAEFAGASRDGSRAFFVSTQQLTDKANEDSDGNLLPNASVGCPEVGCNLYEYDLANPAGHELIDASAGDSSGGGPRVQGVVALSSDGTHVYFAAKGVLTGTANDQGQVAQDGADNLYLFEQDASYPDGRTVFIAGLPSSDGTEWTVTPGTPANVTPEGRFLVFLSHGDLTADDTSASGANQVFRYDATTGALNRVSVGMDGFDDDGNRPAATPCEPKACSEDAEIVQAAHLERSDPSMSDDGARVFFMSPVGLTVHARDDVSIGAAGGLPSYAQNVYEWEQSGAGSCPAAQSAGCVFLISDGGDVSVDGGQDALCGLGVGVPSSVCLLGADTTGANVFFSTADPLVRADTNTEVDYYDARVCEPEEGNPCIGEPPASLPPCLEEACHGTPAGTPSTPADPTATFNGQGNTSSSSSGVVAKPTVKSATRAQKLAAALKLCRRDRSKQRRSRCEATAHKKYGVLKAKKKSSGAAKAGNSDHRRSR